MVVRGVWKNYYVGKKDKMGRFNNFELLLECYIFL